MANVPEEVIERYANEQLQKRDQLDGYVARAVERKLGAALKDVVKLQKKNVSIEDFNKLFEKK